MKRLIQIGILISFILAFGTKSKAAYDVPEEKVLQLQADIYDNFGKTIPTDNAEYMIYYWNQFPFNGKTAYIYQESSFTQIRIIVTDNGTMSGSSLSATQPWYLITWNYNDNTNTTNSNTYGSLSASNVIELGTYTDYGVDPVYYYDESIPAPQFRVMLSRLPNFAQDPEEETNFFEISWELNTSYQIEIGYRYKVPSLIKIGLTDGTVTYSPMLYYSSDPVTVYSGSSINVHLNLDEDDFQWLAGILVNTSDYFTTSVPVWANNWNNGAYNNARENWINRYSKCMPLYGNMIEIYARYYIEDDNHNIYVGQWRQWNNTYPNEYTAVVPSNYQVGTYVPGLTSPVQQFDAPESSLLSGEVTGNNNPSTSVTINQAVPNYPDYPTAASYNHDNVLLQWIQTSLQLPGMFGQFGAFLTSAFTFIPSSFWTIVGFGLMCCIAIMIVKIL